MRIFEKYQKILRATKYCDGKEIDIEINTQNNQYVLHNVSSLDELIRYITYGLNNDTLMYEINKLLLIIEKKERVNDCIVISQEIVHIFERRRTGLNNLLLHSLRNLKALIDFQSENYINVKVPDAYLGDTKNLVTFSKDLDDVFTLIFNKGLEHLSPDIYIKGFDKGSSWVEMVIKNTGTLSIVIPSIFGLLKIASDIAINRKDWLEGNKKKIEIKILEQQLKRDITEEEAERSLKLRQNIENEDKVKNLFKEIGINKDINPEQISALCKGIEKLAHMLEKGVEIHPSLSPPEYIKKIGNDQYDIDYELLKKISSKPKQIEGKSNNE